MKEMNKSYYVKLTLTCLLATLVSIMFFTVLFMLVLASSNIYGQSAVAPFLTAVLLMGMLVCFLIYVAHVYFTYVRLTFIKRKRGIVVCSLIGLHLVPVIVSLVTNDLE